MRWLRLMLCLVLSGCAAVASRPHADTVNELIRLENTVSAASITSNRDALEKLMTPDFAMILGNGKVLRRDELITRWTSAAPGIADPSFAMSDIQVYVYGDTAVVTATTIDRWKINGAAAEYRERIFDVWRMTAVGWRWVASKPTPVSASPKIESSSHSGT